MRQNLIISSLDMLIKFLAHWNRQVLGLVKCKQPF